MNANEVQLVARARAGDESARDQLIIALQPMVRNIARSISTHCANRVDVDDLASIGTFAIIHAIGKYDTDKGIRFSTYATHRIRGAMLDHIRASDPVPRLTRQRTRRLNEARDQFYLANGRAPDTDELQESSGLNDRDFGLYEGDTTRNTVSLEAIVERTSEGHVATINHRLADENAGRAFDAIEARDLMRYILERHGLRAALMLKLRFLDGWTVKRVGTAFIPSRGKGNHAAKRRTEDTISESAISLLMKAVLRDIRTDLGVTQ